MAREYIGGWTNIIRKKGSISIPELKEIVDQHPEAKKRYDKLKKMGILDKNIASHPNLLSYYTSAIERKFNNLKKMGLTDKKIAAHPNLLTLSSKTIERNFNNLREMGITSKKIATLTRLLTRDPAAIKQNFNSLRQIGISKKRIVTLAHLLNLNPETIKYNLNYYRKLGIPYDKIASQPSILARDPLTIERNLNNLVEMGGISYEKAANSIRLLAFNPETLERNLKNLRKMGIYKTSQVQLLVANPETIKEKYKQLKKLGITSKTITSRPELLILNVGNVEVNVRILKELNLDINKFARFLPLRDKRWEKLVLPIEEKIPFASGTIAQSSYKVKAKIDFMRSVGQDELIKKNPNVLIASLATLMHKYSDVPRKRAEIKAEHMNVEYEETYKPYYEKQAEALKIATHFIAPGEYVASKEARKSEKKREERAKARRRKR